MISNKPSNPSSQDTLPPITSTQRDINNHRHARFQKAWKKDINNVFFHALKQQSSTPLTIPPISGTLRTMHHSSIKNPRHQISLRQNEIIKEHKTEKQQQPIRRKSSWWDRLPPDTPSDEDDMEQPSIHSKETKQQQYPIDRYLLMSTQQIIQKYTLNTDAEHSMKMVQESSFKYYWTQVMHNKLNLSRAKIRAGEMSECRRLKTILIDLILSEDKREGLMDQIIEFDARYKLLYHGFSVFESDTEAKKFMEYRKVVLGIVH